MTRQAKVFALRLSGIIAGIAVSYYIGGRVGPAPSLSPDGEGGWIFQSLARIYFGGLALIILGLVLIGIVMGLQELWPEATVEDHEQADKRKLEKERLSDPDFDPLGVRDKINRK